MFRLLLFAIFAFFFYLFFWFDGSFEGFKDGGSNVRILSGVEMRELICVRGSIDYYYDSFSAWDLRARGVSSVSEY
jgi:hypothetical protein